MPILLDLYWFYFVYSYMKKREKMKDSNFKHFNPMALREKYSVNSVKKRNNYSSFWMDNDWDSRNTSIFDNDVEVNTKPKTDLVALAGYRRAISNFVTIVTGESDIKVKFNSNDESYTDGKTVTIGSKLDDKLFDPSVGLALHEGSHIKLSDFNFLKNLENNIPAEYFERALKKGYSSRYEVMSQIKNLLNYVEDRRIDNYVFTTSPGYKGYYHSMYEKYFYSKIVDKALTSTEYTDENMESYMFRIINLTNKNTNLNALNGLRKIWKELDIKNISYLNTTEEAFEVALKMYGVILDNLKDGIEETDEDTGEVTTKPNDDSDDSGESKELSDEEFDRLKKAMESGDVKQGHSNGSEIELTPNQKRQLENAIKKQKKFMDGDIQKKRVTKKESKELKTIEESGMTYETVGKDLGWDKKGVKCLVVRKLTKALIEESGDYDSGLSVLSPHKYSRYYYGSNSTDTGFVEDGIRLGTVLGRKLQVRGESRETKWTRLDSGKIDKRLISELGFGNERVFNTSFIESYSDAFLHISVDASGSMSGRKWDNTMTSVVAITKAASMIQNVDVVVSIRSTHNVGGRGRSSNTVPLILIAYDSRVDKFNKVKNLFAHMKVSGTTPEGLTFEAIMDEIVPTTKDRDSYFLNFSDGMPMFSTDGMSYYQSEALNHTKKMVNEMRTRGIKVLSYFIGDSDDYGREDTMRDFKIMYGKDAQFVDVTSVTSISKTMNKKFLEKN